MASATSRGASYWLQQYTWPVIGVTAATVLSMGVYYKRHLANDPEVASPDQRGGPGESPAQEEGYGRKSAVASGMMEGDRAFQGIFPANKMTEVMAPVLPAKQPGHPSQEQHPENIKTTTPKSRPA